MVRHASSPRSVLGSRCAIRRATVRLAQHAVTIGCAVAVLGWGSAQSAGAQTVEPPTHPAAASPGTPADAVADADAAIERLRQEADSLAQRYFSALGALAELEQRIDEIEARLPALTARADELRERARARAVAAYKRAGHDLGIVIDANGPVRAARRAQWLDRLNARDGALADDLRRASARLAAQRAQLRDTRESAATALDMVRRQGVVIDSLLAEAHARRQAVAQAASTPQSASSGAPTAPDGARSSVPTTTTRLVSTPPTSTPAAPPAAPPTYVPTPGVHPRHDEPFLVCTRTRESGGNYAAYNPAGPYMGAYQFLQTTWNSAANHAGRTDLVAVPPHTASPYDQDDVAWALYQWQGSRPWGGRCDPE
jgi:hypothetical protein